MFTVSLNAIGNRHVVGCFGVSQWNFYSFLLKAFVGLNPNGTRCVASWFHYFTISYSQFRKGQPSYCTTHREQTSHGHSSQQISKCIAPPWSLYPQSSLWSLVIKRSRSKQLSWSPLCVTRTRRWLWLVAPQALVWLLWENLVRMGEMAMEGWAVSANMDWGQVCQKNCSLYL